MAVLEAIWRRRRQNPAFTQRSRLSALPHRQACMGFLLGSPLPGQSDPRTAFAWTGPCIRLLELSGLCARNAEPRRRGSRDRFPQPGGGLWPHLLLVRSGLCTGLRCFHRRPVHSPLFCASHLAFARRARNLLRVRRNRGTDLCADGHLSRGFFCDRLQPRRAPALVGSHTVPGRLLTAGAAHQAPAFDPQPGNDFPLARQLQPDSPPRRRRRLRPGHWQRPDATGQPPGLLLRRVWTLHRALPSSQHRQEPQSQGNYPRRSRLPERIRPHRRRAAAGQIQFAGSRLPMHYLRCLRVPMPGRHRACPHHRRPAARCRQHRSLGGFARHQALSCNGAQFERAGHGWAAWAATTPKAAKSSAASSK